MCQTVANYDEFEYALEAPENKGGWVVLNNGSAEVIVSIDAYSSADYQCIAEGAFIIFYEVPEIGVLLPFSQMCCFLVTLN